MVFLPVDSTMATEPEVDEKAKIPRGNNELVLVVDDEESMRILIKEILENYHYKVITAKDGREAVAKYTERQSEIKVVMTDMLMLGMDGPATIRALREINQKVPIIAMSGLAAGDLDVAGDIGNNVQASITKPFSIGILLKTISRVIQDSAIS